jgi:hypothetical protein
MPNVTITGLEPKRVMHVAMINAPMTPPWRDHR